MDFEEDISLLNNAVNLKSMQTSKSKSTYRSNELNKPSGNIPSEQVA